MAISQITKRLVDNLKPQQGEYFVWDGSLSGFGVRVQSTGAKSYVVKYRAGSGRSDRSERSRCRSYRGRCQHLFRTDEIRSEIRSDNVVNEPVAAIGEEIKRIG